MLRIRMAPAEQQDLLAALDVFLSLPLYLAKQARRINKGWRELPQAWHPIYPTGSPGMTGGHQPGINTLSCGWQGMPGAVSIASPSPSPTQPNYFGVPAPRGESEQGFLPFPYSAGCQQAQALPKDVILFLQAIKPFALQAASSLQLSHAWPRAISGLKKLVFAGCE